MPLLWSCLPSRLRGIFTLWFDMRLLDDESHQVTRHQDGTLTVFGLYKKAVAQSMPWIGILAALAVYRVRPSDRFGLVFCLLAIAVWTDCRRCLAQSHSVFGLGVEQQRQWGSR